MADKLVELLESTERQKALAMQNFSAALRMTMPRIIQEYVRHFGVAQQTRALRRIRWHRRLPGWISRSFLGKALLRGGRHGAGRQLPFPATRHLFNGNGHSREHLGIAGGANHGHGVGGSSLGLAHPPASAGGKSNGGTNHDDGNATADKILPIYLPDPYPSHHPEREQTRVDEPIRLPAPKSGGNGLS